MPNHGNTWLSIALPDLDGCGFMDARMIEGKPPVASGQRVGRGDGEPLRELTWGDLVARLNAARDLRRELGIAESEDAQAGATASFDADSARRISAQANGEDLVNQTASAYRKTIPAKGRHDQFGARENK